MFFFITRNFMINSYIVIYLLIYKLKILSEKPIYQILSKEDVVSIVLKPNLTEN